MKVLDKQKTILIDYDTLPEKSISKYIANTNNEFVIVYTSDLDKNKIEIADTVTGVPVSLLIVSGAESFKLFVNDVIDKSTDKNDITVVSSYYYNNEVTCVKSLSEIGFLKLNSVYDFPSELLFYIMKAYIAASVLYNDKLNNEVEYLMFDTESNNTTLKNIVLNSEEMVNYDVNNPNTCNFYIGEFSGKVNRTTEEINLNFKKDVYHYFESRVKYIIDYIMSM